MTGAGATRARRAVPVRALLLVVVVVVLGLTAGAAVAFWSAGSATGGSGAAAATELEQGHTPTATAGNGGSTVAVSWAAGTLASGGAVSGYQIRRYPTGLPTAQTILTGCAGTIAELSCTETGMPPGSWEYTVTPLLADSWRGPESARSAAVSTESRHR